MRNFEQKSDGFSLIELLIVIVILGILAAVVVFSVRGITDNGQDSACQADERTLATATEAYFAEYAASTIEPTDGSVEQTLIAAELLREESQYWDLASDGTVTPVTPCP
ncbi:type II secretion system protein [Ilumatobacter fluminis]|uniref:type II secretion system protein n=1 Tax=Ilumatobacter fluminis TaxID=467091 RepID=UPI00105CB064|nr:type II secretion system protein [Ilumatobacter fluminis]